MCFHAYPITEVVSEIQFRESPVLVNQLCFTVPCRRCRGRFATHEGRVGGAEEGDQQDGAPVGQAGYVAQHDRGCVQGDARIQHAGRYERYRANQLGQVGLVSQSQVLKQKANSRRSRILHLAGSEG